MFDDACHHGHSWTEMFLCHSIKIGISLEHPYQSSPFFHHCKGKFMTNLEIDIICSRFFLFLKYSSHPMIAFFMTHPVYVAILWSRFRNTDCCKITSRYIVQLLRTNCIKLSTLVNCKGITMKGLQFTCNIIRDLSLEIASKYIA